MHKKPIKKLFHSVFTRLLLAILIVGMAITFGVIGGFMALKRHSLVSLDRNLAVYSDYLIGEMGNPPRLDKAEKIARRTGMIILFKSNNHHWETAAIPRNLHLEKVRMVSQEPGREIGFYRGHHIVSITKERNRLTFILPWGGNGHKAMGQLFVTMAAIFVAILTAAYFYLRRVLKPIRQLKNGVEKVGAGDLSHRVPLGRNDEFHDLAAAFNRMAKRLDALLKTKEQLLLDVSHELRSPLTRLKVALEFLPDDETRTTLAEDVGEMEKMITEILEAARIRKSAAALNLVPVKPADLIRDVLPDFTDRRPGVVFSHPLETELTLDASKIETVIRNLLDNALKYSAPDGDPVAISMEVQADDLTITIEDKGIGIAADDLPFVFEPFYRADDSRTRKTGGYGLGLSLCRTIMTAHGATIDIHSQVGHGTQVILCFPMSDEV